MRDFILFVGSSILTTVATILTVIIIFITIVYLISSIKLVVWSIRTRIFKNPFMWINPLKLIEYSGQNTTLHTDEGDYIIYYQSILPETKFISNDLK